MSWPLLGHPRPVRLRRPVNSRAEGHWHGSSIEPSEAPWQFSEGHHTCFLVKMCVWAYCTCSLDFLQGWRCFSCMWTHTCLYTYMHMHTHVYTDTSTGAVQVLTSQQVVQSPAYVVLFLLLGLCMHLFWSGFSHQFFLQGELVLVSWDKWKPILCFLGCVQSLMKIQECLMK
jgi:hypothetical protein